MSYAQAAYEQAYHDTPVREFHQAFEHPISYDPGQPPSIDQRVLRVRMLAEELVELARAFGVQLKVDSTEAGDETACVIAQPVLSVLTPNVEAKRTVTARAKG